MNAFQFVVRRCSRLSLPSLFIGLILVFVVFTLVTYTFLNGSPGPYVSRRDSRTVTSGRSETINILDNWSHRLPRIYSYCNPFTTISFKDELEPSVDSQLKLLKVVVLTRHGDRGPLRTVRNQSMITCDPFVVSKESKIHSLLKRFFIELKDRLRHTLRDKRISSVSKLSSLELGQLNGLGFAQHIALGTLIGQTYKNRLNIDFNTIKVYSTPYSRTYQSAVAFVYGVLTPKTIIDFKKFPQITNTYGTYFCNSPEFCIKECPKMKNLQTLVDQQKHQVLSSHPSVVKLIDDLKPIITNRLNESQLFENPIALFDGLMAYLCHNTALPCDDNNKCISIEEVKQLISFIEFNGKHLVANNVFKHLSWLKIYGFLNHLVKVVANRDSRQTLVLYSAHDITIVALASALDFFDGTIPPYASRVIFEIYVDKTKDQNIYLKIIYNGKDVTRFTDICRQNPSKCLFSDSKQPSYLIAFTDFTDFIRKKFEFFTQTNDFQKSCKS